MLGMGQKKVLYPEFIREIGSNSSRGRKDNSKIFPLSLNIWNRMAVCHYNYNK
jgi:hypothetical protein